MYGVMNSERVRELCEEKGMSRRDLADAAGISLSTARNAERGAVVQGRTVHKIAKALERVMNSIRNGLGMRKTEITSEPS